MLESRLRDLLCEARDAARARGIQAEFCLHRERSSLIRLGNSSVALSTSEELTRLDVEVTDGCCTGGCGIVADLTSPTQVRDVIDRAQEICAASPARDYQPIFGGAEESIDDEVGYDPALDSLTAEAKSALCAEIIRTIKPRGAYDFSGSWSSGATEIYYTSTASDCEQYRRLTDGRLVLVLKEGAKKWELSVEQTGKCAADFSAAAAIDELDALLPIYASTPGYRTALGHQRVLFGPRAIAALVELAVWGGLTGRGWEEGRAFTAGKPFGELLFSPTVTLIDDPTNPQVFRMPFDLKGQVRRPFPLVEAGVFRGLIYSAGAAAKYRRSPTGHHGVSPDLTFAPGEAPAGLTAGLALAGDALYIPHLHYIHMPDPSRGQFTGSSRFNALRVEGGQLTAPLLSSRITDTVPAVLSSVLAVAARTVPVNVSDTYSRRAPQAISVPEYLLCEAVRISDVAESF
jgi:predicted Zn-dependent protease